MRRRRGGAVTRLLGILLLVILALIAAYAINVATGMRAAAPVSGTLNVSGIQHPVTIVRDDRDIPHIRAANDRDLFFAQGFAEGCDRLFQMELLRRYVYGTLAEIFGPGALPADEHARIVDMQRIVQRQWSAMNPRDRALVQAFSNGVNAAMRTAPLPVEFHILLYRPRAWMPQDSLAVGMATVLDLIDPWEDVIRRDDVARTRGAAPQRDLYTITDPAYDAPIAPAVPMPVASLRPRGAIAAMTFGVLAPSKEDVQGSNEWAVGASHSASGRALLANDPHLGVSIPGVWYLVDLRSNDVHVAGASLPGTPGVILGHNGDIAWGATNATVATESVYRDTIAGTARRKETFHVRFAPTVSVTYYRTDHGFVAEKRGATAFAVDWNADRRPVTPLDAFEGLDRAHSIAEAKQALRSYPGPPQNFVLADRSGAVAYELAGVVPNDPAWGLRVHAATEPRYGYMSDSQLPHVDASADALLFTANNRMYGAGYPYRLSPAFSAPYRAERIRTLLHRKARLSVADLSAMQSDTLSPAELELARDVLKALRRSSAPESSSVRRYAATLHSWNGRFDPNSRAAPIVLQLRRMVTNKIAQYNAADSAQPYQSSADNAAFMLAMRILRERPRGWWRGSNYDGLLIESLQTIAARNAGLPAWRSTGCVPVRHALANLGFAFLNGGSLPGDGDAYGIHVQTSEGAQSFRAVWEIGNWDSGGIVIPSGESGQPGSGHYLDLRKTWLLGTLVPLPFSDAAVGAAARAHLVLERAR